MHISWCICYHTKCAKKCGLRTDCNAVLKELGPKTLNWIVARSSHNPKHTPPATHTSSGKSQLAALHEVHHTRYVHMGYLQAVG
jgi:hypothetical protein